MFTSAISIKSACLGVTSSVIVVETWFSGEGVADEFSSNGPIANTRMPCLGRKSCVTQIAYAKVSQTFA